MANIIGRIALQPAIVRPGESVRVEVFDNDDNPHNGRNTQVSINGVPGALQFLQFPTVGQRRLIVRARAASGETDRQVALLDVTGAPLEFPSLGNRSDIAMIGVTQLPTQPYTAVLTLGSSVDTRSPHLLGIGPSVSPLAGKAFARDSLAARLATRGALGRAISANPQALTRIETRRLTNTRAKETAQPAKGVRRTPKAATRYAVGAVYDLTNVDLSGFFGKVGTALSLEFEWDFGDGSTATTHAPVVNHDYFAAIDHAAGVGQFVVTCHVKHAGITVKRTLTIHSAYAICKGTGTVVPHVTADLFAHKRYSMLTGMFTVHNVEDAPIVLDRMSITPTTEDGDALALPRPFVNLDHPITIAARSASMVGVNVPFVTGTPQTGELRFDVKSFSVLYAGKVGTFPVRCRAVFDVPVPEWSKKPQPLILTPEDVPPKQRKPWPWELVEKAFEAVVNPADQTTRPGYAVLDAKTGTLAVSLGPLQNAHTKALTRAKGVQVLSAVYAPIDAMMEARRMATPAARFLSQAVEGNVLKTHLASFAPKLTIPDFGGGVRPFTGPPPPPGPIAEGQVCHPDQLTEEDLAVADKGQLACQLTSKVDNYLIEARWMNARKGDCILSPGGDGIIGGLMLNVEPPQWYSHSGIMTRNYDEITHSTGSPERLMHHLIGFSSDGSDGFEPSVLKYMWPGAVTQTVQHSIEGEEFPDPEYEKTYSISAFGPHTVGITHNDQMVMIPPLVVKPDPMQETPAVRMALHAIATDARNDAGRPGVKPKYHYRWYCYTDPTIGLGAPEGPEAGWAAGTRASVCSSYIWLHAKARNAHLEADQSPVKPTDLELSDPVGETDPIIGPTTPDGLYNYSAQERSDAAYWLYDTIYNQAYQEAGWLGEILTDAADDTANQFLNAFANDDADGKDSDAWKNVTDADAVSPDNMLRWDSPALGGLYGFAEPAIYREPRVESYTVSRWKKVLSRGTVRGKVFGEAGPVAGAHVRIHEGPKGWTHSWPDGSFALDDVPLGSWMLKGSAQIQGVLWSAQISINLNVAELVVDIHLLPPADCYRIAKISIDFFGFDEENPGDYEKKEPGLAHFERELGPDKVTNSLSIEYRWGDELRAEYTITMKLLVDYAIDVQVKGKLYEGESDTTDDIDGWGEVEFQVAVGHHQGTVLAIMNTEEGDDDLCCLGIGVENVRNNN